MKVHTSLFLFIVGVSLGSMTGFRNLADCLVARGIGEVDSLFTFFRGCTGFACNLLCFVGDGISKDAAEMPN